MMIRLLFLTFALLLTTNVSAEDRSILLDLPRTQVLLEVSASVSQEIEQNLLTANLSFQTSDIKLPKVQNSINKKMAEAVKILKASKEVKFNTGRYNVYQSTVAKTKEKQWFGNQSIVLKSQDSAALLGLVAELQKLGFNTNNLNYEISHDLRVKTQDALMEKAILELQSKANRAAKTLKKSNASLRKITIATNPGNNYSNKNRSLYASANIASDSSVPVAAAGEDRISLTVVAQAILE